MSQQNQWLFEMPSGQMVQSLANPEDEIFLENEWEVHPRRPTSQRNRGSVRRPPQSIKRTANRPQRQRRPAMHRQHPGGRSFQSPQGSRTGTGGILIATIDRFEFGSYLLKRPQFEKLHALVLLLDANKTLFPGLQLTFRGHTDHVGGETAGNWFLAGRRAIEVESFIKRIYQKDCPGLVTFFTSGGTREPVSPNANRSEAGRARTRRVEVFSNISLQPIQPNPGSSSTTTRQQEYELEFPTLYGCTPCVKNWKVCHKNIVPDDGSCRSLGWDNWLCKC
jgi:outer membrane protein OmpA-like peptidoglycan-associated protein